MSDENTGIESDIGNGQATAPACPYGHKGSTFYLHGWRCSYCGVRITVVVGREY